MRAGCTLVTNWQRLAPGWRVHSKSNEWEGKEQMSLEELKRQFIVDDDVLKSRLEPIVAKALAHCRIDKIGQVHITNTKLSGKDQVKLALAARAIGSQMDATIVAEVTVAEISRYTGLPGNQVRARGKDAIEDKFAQSPRSGVYCAFPHKVEAFLDSISAAQSKGKSSKDS